MNIVEVVIIGGGPAGLTAGLYCKRAALETVLIEKGLVGGQIAISKDVENYPGMEEITGFDLAEKMQRQARSFGLDIVQQEVAGIRPGGDRHTVTLADGTAYSARAVILATGSTVRKIGVPGEAEYLGRGVSYCATCDGFFFRGKDVIVVGGGDTAVEEALYLARLARTVRLVHRRSALRASKLLQNRLFEDKRIRVLWDRVVADIAGNDGAVRQVTLEHRMTGERTILSADGVFIFIGSEPNAALLPPGIRRDEWGYVITDEKCETSLPGIFAAGDLRKKYANQIIVAAADGCIAALGAAHYIETRQSSERIPAET